MATTLNDRKHAREVLKSTFDEWEAMSDDELLECLQKRMCCKVESKSRHSTLKYLVLYFIEDHMF